MQSVTTIRKSLLGVLTFPELLTVAGITDLSTGLCWRTVHLETEGIGVVEPEIEVDEDWSDNEDYNPSFILEVFNKKGSVIISIEYHSTQEIKEVLDTIRVVNGARINITTT